MHNVLHIDSEFGWRGGQQQAVYLAEGLLAKGYKTAMVCQPGSELEAYCIKTKIPHYPVRMKGEIDFFAAIKIATICRKENFTLLHLHSAHALATGLWVKLFHSSVKLIGVRRVDFHIKKNVFSQYKYKSIKVERHVCISENIRKVMIDDGVSSDRLITIHSGVNLNRFRDVHLPNAFKKNLGIPENHLVIGTIAALAGHKDYPNLLHAARSVISSHQNVTFCAVGDGPDEKEIQQLAKDLNLGSRFIFTGYRTDVGNFLNLFDVFVLASYLEGLGTSLLDAQACGLPVIGCDTGGIPEIISNKLNGLLVPPRDSEALADAIKMLINDSEERIQYGKEGQLSVEKFSIKNTIKNNIQLYQALE